MLRAATAVVGSKRVWKDGWSLREQARLSEMKKRSNLPRSAMRAPASSMDQLQLLSHAPSMRQLAEFFFFNDTATTEIYTLSLHDALPIYNLPKIAAARKTEPAKLAKLVRGE